MINSVALNGRLTRDVDLRYTTSGIAVGQFTLAVDRRFKSKSGNRETDFISCQIWRKSAENLANYAHKGSLIGIEGRIQTRTYDNKQGQKIYITEVIAENFSLLEPKPAQQTDNARVSSNRDTQGTTNQPSGKPIDVNDDDLPF
ncbi:single-stranded DNA-binding protein [Lacticaseibacillus paracasei]|uniref:single-stranded DNA-binding protein n=1 Tax=Lacticaseibacillus paracasei TaxID=1597 RepID=UPI000E5D6287|nr:single-stranded DNA-binding protein [Lacticaseibacillus paracasei]MCT3370199.1 single-stranded DNA-binding protein [Lacticaseibacillus paracasei]